MSKCVDLSARKTPIVPRMEGMVDASPARTSINGLDTGMDVRWFDVCEGFDGG